VSVPLPQRTADPAALPAIAASNPARPSRKRSSSRESASPTNANPPVALRTTHPPERRNKPAPGKRAVAKPALAQEPPETPAKKLRASITRSHWAPAPEFRRALALSIGEAKRAGNPSRAKDKGRAQRVSVRLSRAEERQLQAGAAKAGVTVSEYLRMCALETADAPHGKTAVEAAPQPAKPARSGLGDWIALLRNRFLASPVRFAERA
jgi:hypothetical protein